MKKHPIVYIGACEYEVIMSRTKKESDQHLGKPVEKGDMRWTARGRCLLDEKKILVRHDLKNKQDRYEVLLHEGIHAICHENSEIESLVNLGSDEVAVSIMSKGVASFLRQIRDNGVLD